jgi:acyl-CoA reductase-like NAD-dependent aldehyde dehydrogenase
MSAPLGGYKQSGNGRQFGLHGLMEFFEIKSITTDTLASSSVLQNS